jgi:hypothetical protein
MSKRSGADKQGQLLLSPGLKDAPVLDLMCSHFVLTLAARQGAKFNVRRDLNSLLSLSGRHLVWPLPALQRLREFLGRRCRDNEFWRGHELLSDTEFMNRHGAWRGPYEEGTLFFYLDEHAKDQPKDLLSVLGATGEWLTQALKKQSTLVEKNITALANLLQLNQAERALLLYGTLARYQRDLRSLLVEFKVSNAPEAYAAIAEVAEVPAELVAAARASGSVWRLLALSEDWCGDAVNTLPVIARLARDVGWDFRVLSRDASPDLMDAHLTNGRSRSIPVVIVYDEAFREVGWWGPRPEEIQAWILGEGLSMPSPERYKVVRRWYAKDRGRTTVTELLGVLNRAA